MEALKYNTTLTEIDLSDNGLGCSDESLVAIAELLKHNTTLTKIDFSSNDFDDENLEGAIVLAEALKYNTTLKEIDLGDNFVWEVCNFDGINPIAEIIRYNTSLEKINLNNNRFWSIDLMKDIVEALKHNATLTVFDLSGENNFLDEDITEAFADVLEHNTTLKEINFDGNFTDGYDNSEYDIGSIVESLKHNKTLTKIDFGLARICKSNVIALAEALQYNRTLTEITLKLYLDPKREPIKTALKEIRKETRQNKVVQKCWELWILEEDGIEQEVVNQPRFNSFLQWLPREILEDTVGLFTSKKMASSSVEYSQLSLSTIPFFKRKRESDSPDLSLEEKSSLPPQRRRVKQTDSDTTPDEVESIVFS
jgi:Ran GTPase-activating protein (RanGAP) involved in mRNA processing and transport